MCAQEWIWLVKAPKTANDSQKVADTKLNALSGDLTADTATQTKGRVTMKLLPLSSRKSCLVIA